MEYAMSIAQIFGPFLFITGLWMLLCHENAKKVVASVKACPSILYVMGAWNLFLGLVIVNEYNVWMWGPTLLVTLLGWVMIVRGVCTLLFPRPCIEMTLGTPVHIRMVGLITLIWGALLFWLVAMSSM